MVRGGGKFAEGLTYGRQASVKLAPGGARPPPINLQWSYHAVHALRRPAHMSDLHLVLERCRWRQAATKSEATSMVAQMVVPRTVLVCVRSVARAETLPRAGSGTWEFGAWALHGAWVMSERCIVQIASWVLEVRRLRGPAQGAAGAAAVGPLPLYKTHFVHSQSFCYFCTRSIMMNGRLVPRFLLVYVLQCIKEMKCGIEDGASLPWPARLKGGSH